jgi:integrase
LSTGRAQAQPEALDVEGLPPGARRVPAARARKTGGERDALRARAVCDDAAARPERAKVKGWYDELPYGRTSEKLLMIVRAILAHARSRGWIEHEPGRRGRAPAGPLLAATTTSTRARKSTRSSRAAASDQDGAIYLTAAMTGLRRGELVALRWRDIDFPGQAIRVRANYSFGELVTPKSGKVRSVPMVQEVAEALARLSQREHFTS